MPGLSGFSGVFPVVAVLRLRAELFLGRAAFVSVFLNNLFKCCFLGIKQLFFLLSLIN